MNIIKASEYNSCQKSKRYMLFFEDFKSCSFIIGQPQLKNGTYIATNDYIGDYPKLYRVGNIDNTFPILYIENDLKENICPRCKLYLH